MILRKTFLALLTAALLIAQQAAFAHVVSHAGETVPVKEQLAHSKLCGKCVNFDKLSGAPPVVALALPGLDVSHIRPAAQAHHRDPRTVVGFHSRAPPVSL
jgi:hypothetical protein